MQFGPLIECPQCKQVHQLATDRIVSGIVHIVGHPVCSLERNVKRREIYLTKTAFGTLLQEEAMII